MEFDHEIKESLCNDIETLKRLLDTLANEIKDIESGNPLEFIAPLMSVNHIEADISSLKSVLRALSDMGTEDITPYQE